MCRVSSEAHGSGRALLFVRVESRASRVAVRRSLTPVHTAVIGEAEHIRDSEPRNTELGHVGEHFYPGHNHASHHAMIVKKIARGSIKIFFDVGDQVAWWNPLDPKYYCYLYIYNYDCAMLLRSPFERSFGIKQCAEQFCRALLADMRLQFVTLAYLNNCKRSSAAFFGAIKCSSEECSLSAMSSILLGIEDLCLSDNGSCDLSKNHIREACRKPFSRGPLSTEYLLENVSKDLAQVDHKSDYDRLFWTRRILVFLSS